ncbi:MAG: hypothetical protein NVSMB52_09890 [Chloroflexota bacterium]
MLGQLESNQRVVIADMEAGIGTLTRMGENSLDLVLLVANPSEKSLEVVRRAREIISERKIAPNSIVVANRLGGEDDLHLVHSALRDLELAEIPEDPEVRQADIQGTSPADTAPPPPAVRAVVSLAQSLQIDKQGQ